MQAINKITPIQAHESQLSFFI